MGRRMTAGGLASSRLRWMLPGLTLAGLLFIGACSEVPDWANPVEWYNETEDAVSSVFEDDDSEVLGAPEVTTEYEFDAELASVPDPYEEPIPGASDDFPNLATVPDEVPPASSADDLDALMAELISDREAAQYTDEVIRIEPMEEAGLAQSAQPTAAEPAPALLDDSERALGGGITVVDIPSAYEAPVEPYQPPTIVELDPVAPYVPPQPASGGLEIVELDSDALLRELDELPGVPAPAPGLVVEPIPGAQTTIVEAPIQMPGDHGVYNVFTFKQMFDQVFNATGATTYAATSTAAYEGVVLGEPGVMSDAGPERYLPAVSFQAAVIYFENGQAWLPNDAKTQLKDVVALHEAYGGKVRIVGHASMRTRDMDLGQHQIVNFQLSADRAQIVADELMRMGIPASAVLISAEGDNKPVTYEYMPAGELENRRAEVFIEY